MRLTIPSPATDALATEQISRELTGTYRRGSLVVLGNFKAASAHPLKFFCWE